MRKKKKKNMKKMGRRQIILLYGSEYGTAYDCCRNLLYELYTHFEIDFLCLNDIDIKDLYKYENVIIIVSTTGYGCYTHNMSNFWINLHISNVILDDDVYFHLFGLGDSSYDNYNIVAKKLKKKLKLLGANIVNYNLGNYQHASMHFTNFNIWKNKVYKFLNNKYMKFDTNYDIPCLFNVTYVGNVYDACNTSTIATSVASNASTNVSTNTITNVATNTNTSTKHDNYIKSTINNGNHLTVIKNNDSSNMQPTHDYLSDPNNKKDTNQINKVQTKEVCAIKKSCTKYNIIDNEIFNIDKHFCDILKFIKFEIIQNEKSTDESENTIPNNSTDTNKSHEQNVRYINLLTHSLSKLSVSNLIS
uniref:Flavodoxin-like domain-containing protein n=1 Tax=Piliocolobus tephrosceles TaxID=591936 RepID=A0A8C9GK39_9PRIM